MDFHVDPRSRAGKIIVLVFSFWAMIMTAAYTANLASHFISSNIIGNQLRNIDDAIALGYKICVWRGTPPETYLRKSYPKANLVLIDKEYGEYESMKNGTCDVAVILDSSWRIAKIKSDIIGDCNQVEEVSMVIYNDSGFGVKNDYKNFCTNLVADVFDWHLLNMKNDGTLDTLMENYLKKKKR